MGTYRRCCARQCLFGGTDKTLSPLPLACNVAAVQHASARGHQDPVDIVAFLLSCDVKIDSKDRVGSGHLWFIAAFRFCMLYVLISCPVCCLCSQEGDTALHDAVRLNRYKIVKLLVEAEADTKIKNHVRFFFSHDCTSSIYINTKIFFLFFFL